ncbi:MAG: cyclase family protein [Bacteroidota bacterium]|nr:cyclase family protein [Bacteroidota bacterium]
MTVIDLTHPITDNMPVYFPWHPATEIVQTATYAHDRCEVRRLAIGTHSGTHIDAPSHILEGTPALDKYDPNLWCMKAQVLDFTPRQPRQEIMKEEVQEKLKQRGIGVIIKAGWDVHFGKNDYYKTYPPISNAAAEFFLAMNVPLVAADTPFTLDVHYLLLRRGIPLVTNLNNTARLKEGIVTLISAPLLIAGADGAPARVFALVEKEG